MVWVLVAAGGVMGAWAAYTTVSESNLEKPDYAVLVDDGPIEIRNYPPFVVAGTSLEPGVNMGQGFRVLARYIFGGNRADESMAMTAPVMQQYGAGSGLPGVSDGPEGSSRMAFVMSASRSKDQLPTPNSDAVELAELDLGQMATFRFGGWGWRSRFEKAESKLRTWLTENGYSVRGEPMYAQYNSPTAFPLLRRNEVLIPVKPRDEP